MKTAPRNILIRGVNWIGDAVMTIPAMRGLRQVFPESKITLLIREPMDRLFGPFSAVDRVLGFRVRNGLQGLKDRWELIRKLRNEHFDLCLILPNSFDSALIAFLSGIPERVGFNRDGRGLLLTRKLPFCKGKTSRHQAEDYLSLVAYLGKIRGPMPCHIEVEESAKAWAREQVPFGKKDVSGPWICLNPGATYGPAKRWFPERFAQLANRVSAEDHAGIVIVGGAEEAELCESIAGRIHGKTVNLCGKTDLQQLAAVLSLCDLVVTNDSGPMHVASAVGVPVVAVFGSTEPGATSPIGKHLIVRKACECSPCLDRVCARGDMLCMEQIQVDDVYEAVTKLLHGRESRCFVVD